MAVDVIMPQMGESIFEGTITKWLKKPGDKIERDEPLFEISTDKVDAEIPSPSAGVLKEIKVNEGQTVPIQTVVAVIDADGAGAAAAAPAHFRSGQRSRASPRLQRPSRPRLRLLPPAAKPRRACAAHPPLRAAKKFAAPRSCARLRAKTILISRKCPAPAPAAASASTTSWRRRRRRGRAPRAQRDPRAPAPRLRRRGRLLHLRRRAAPPLPPFSKTPSRARKCTSATTKSSRCP